MLWLVNIVSSPALDLEKSVEPLNRAITEREKYSRRMTRKSTNSLSKSVMQTHLYYIETF